MTKNGFAVWAALVFALALNLQGAWPGEPESQLTKGVGGGMHEDKDAATKFSNPVPVDGRAHNYGADVVSKQVMERASVAPVDPEMFWNHPMSHSDVTRAPFKGTITPQEIKDDGYFSKFWGKMKSGAGGAGPGGAGDQTWDFFGKMETFGIASAQARVFNKELAHVKAKENVKFQAKVTMTSSGHEGKLIYHWDFGDGTTSQDKNPTHQYYEGGVKNVTLTVKLGPNDKGKAATCKVHVLTGVTINYPQGGRISFNDSNYVSGHAVPASLPACCHALLDWDMDKIKKDDCNITNAASGELNWTRNWPTSNKGWGPGDALIVSVNEPRFGGNDLDSAGTLRASVPMTKFYSATTSENPTEDPNWFYYYKDNAGGGAYTYTRYGPSMSLAGRGDHSIKIADEAYAGDKYIITHIDNGQLKAVTLSGMNYYYANFTGVLAHERQHAKNEVPDDHPDDNDNDHLTNAFEVSTSHTDPNVSDSARGSLPADIDCDDGEIYAGGVVEEEAIKNADTSEDWAHPGTNWH